MATPTRVLLQALLWTAVVLYANSILQAMALPQAGPVFFSSQDLFADFIKLTASYPAQAAVKLEAWLPPSWKQIISDYLANIPYGNDPARIHGQLTHFGLPPLAQIIYIASRHLFGSVGAMTSLIGALAAGALWLLWCTSQALQNRRERLLFTACSLLIYPGIFLLTRGNIASLYSSLAVSSAFLLALQPTRPAALPILMLSLATGLRPNNIVYGPLLAILSSQTRRRSRPWRMLAAYGGCLFLSLALFFVVLHWLYPPFSLERFLASYRWISQHYDTDPTNVLFVSSPLQISNLLLTRVLGPQGAEAVLPIVKATLLVSGLGICLCSFLLRWRGGLSAPTSILLCTAGMILATPWFVNYHLLILIAPLLCWGALQQRKPGADQPSPDPDLDCLSRLDRFTIISLLVPKPFALAGAVPDAGVLVNPLILAVYAALVIWRQRRGILALRLRGPGSPGPGTTARERRA